jgi:tetratricopeptide (TPR) repeat protein
MSYDLCLSVQAEKPYYIESIRTPVYSLEELCFYLYNNICLIDQTIINEELCDWVRDQLRLPRLYRQLYEQLEKQDGAAFFVLPIFREAGYLGSKELYEFQDRLSRLEAQSADMKQKLRGDYLVKEKMYARAIWEYRQILNRQTPGKLGIQFYAAVWNNMGAAFAGLFQFEKAAECFSEAYRMTGTRESLRKYISVLPLFLSGEAYQNRLRELKADPYLVNRIQDYNAQVCRQPAFQTQMRRRMAQGSDTLLRELKEQYCRSTVI